MSVVPFITRFAPNPSGQLHLGNARTALLNFLAARASGGRFILRVEDAGDLEGADRHLSTLLADLKWLGIDWDEGPDVGGPHTLYHQRERRQIYEHWLAQLDALGLTYPCFCTPAEIAAAQRRHPGRKSRSCVGSCRELTDGQRCDRLVRGESAALRFRVPQGRTIEVDDLVHGRLSFVSDELPDFVIRAANGCTATFFSSAVDDALMGVTLVLRGADHLVHAPRQRLILDCLGLAAPRYAHVPLLAGTGGAPLSNRKRRCSVSELRRHGFLASALRNYLARLGHSISSDRLLTTQELISAFSTDGLDLEPARYAEEQARCWQKRAIDELTDEDFLIWTADHLPTQMPEVELLAFARCVRRDILFPQDVKRWSRLLFDPHAAAGMASAHRALDRGHFRAIG